MIDFNGIRIAGVDYESMADGEGVRAALFFSGCPHACPGCHNPEAQNYNYGKLVTLEMIQQINSEIEKRPFLSGVTLSGGDPLSGINVYGVLTLLPLLTIPHNDLWVYTGYTFEAIRHNYLIGNILSKTKVLVDGRFVQSLADKRLQFKGSSNQRIIDVQRSQKYGCTYEYKLGGQ